MLANCASWVSGVGWGGADAGLAAVAACTFKTVFIMQSLRFLS